MEKYKEIKNILSTGTQIKEKIIQYNHEVGQSSCDKHGIGFNIDDRFNSAKITLTIDCYTGYYGNSSCSGIDIVKDQKVFSKFFIQTLNKNFRSLMFETADSIILYADSNKQEALKDLKTSMAELEALSDSI